MGIIAFIVLGLIAGVIAKAIMPSDDPGGIIVTSIIGVAGALFGGFVAAALSDAHPLDEFFDISTWLTAILGAIVLLVLYRIVADRGRHGRTMGAAYARSEGTIGPASPRRLKPRAKASACETE